MEGAGVMWVRKISDTVVALSRNDSSCLPCLACSR